MIVEQYALDASAAHRAATLQGPPITKRSQRAKFCTGTDRETNIINFRKAAIMYDRLYQLAGQARRNRHAILFLLLSAYAR